MIKKSVKIPASKALVCSPHLFIWCKNMFDNHIVVADNTMKKTDFYYFSPYRDPRMVDTTTGLVYHYHKDHLKKVRQFEFLRLKNFWPKDTA